MMEGRLNNILLLHVHKEETDVLNLTEVARGEVGMAVPKSTQTRVVGIITYMVHPYACF